MNTGAIIGVIVGGVLGLGCGMLALVLVALREAEPVGMLRIALPLGGMVIGAVVIGVIGGAMASSKDDSGENE